MPGAGRTRDLACKESCALRTQASTGQPKHSGIPCAVVYGLLRALPGDRAFLPPSPRGLTPRINASIGASGQHDFARPRLPAIVAAGLRVHRIPPQRFVTCATPLLSGET